MSFFLKENFNLPNGAFQDGIDTATAAGGTVYQDGTYGYIKTYADADAAIIVSEDSLTPGEFCNKPIEITVSYQLTSLPASDYLRVFQIVQKATRPAVGSLGTMVLNCWVYNNAGTYYEIWGYTNGANAYYWKQSTTAWVTPYALASFVRAINLITTRTVTITINPATGCASFSNATQSATTGVISRGTTPYWWYLGDEETASSYGQLLLDYIYVEDIGVRNRFTLRNCLTSAYRKSPILTILNNLTTQHRDSFTLKNSILDHTPYRSDFTLLNNIGVEGQLIYLDGAWVTRNIKGKQLQNACRVEIDGLDVSDKVNDWSIDYDDQVICKTVSVTVKDRAFAQSIKLRKYNDSTFDDARLEIIDVDGYSLGEFLIDDKSENAASKSYSCTLSGRSMTALLDKPYSDRLNTLYDEATTKLEVVGDLATDKSLTVEWGIPDSILPIGALTADDEPPMSIIKKVVEAGGGLVYTNREDHIVCAYKDYETIGKTPVMSLASGDIVSISTSRMVPDGENSVEVSGYEDMAITGGWATVTLASSKSRLNSNGYDSCILTARCWNEDNSIPTVTLISEEEQTPARNDHYEISVSYMIDTEGGGVVQIKKKSDSSVVAGPYEILDDKRTIRVGTAMDDTDYQITYWGGETVTFSVDNYADVSPSEVLIKDGKAQTTLRASAGGGGWAVCSADFLDAQTAKVNVQIADARVGSINMSADPSTVNVGGTSTIKIAVLDSEGYAAQNGLVVQLSVSDQYDVADYTGNVTPASVTTTTETITDGTPESPTYSTNEITVTTEFPITALTSIYRYIGGAAYTDVNYASGATFDGNTITLATPLPLPDTPLTIVYTAGGMATATYVYPSTNETPLEGRFNYVRGFCGEYGSCRVEIRGPQGNNSEDPRNGSNQIYYIEFAGKFTPGGNSNGQQRFSKTISWMSNDVEPSVRTSQATSDITGGVIAAWNVSKFSNSGPTLVELTMQANTIFYSYDSQMSDGSVSGKRLVIDEDTRKPIYNATVDIDWSGLGTYADGADETGLKTGIDGIFYFEKGKAGETHNIRITKSGYDTLTSTITIPGDVYAANAATSVYDACTFSVRVPVYNIIR